MADSASRSTGKDKRADFVRLAESRTRNAMRSIRTIAKLGNRSHYEFDDADVRKIAAALTREIETLKARMGERSPKDDVDFKL